jgi:hypothetical protein
MTSAQSAALQRVIDDIEAACQQAGVSAAGRCAFQDHRSGEVDVSFAGDLVVMQDTIRIYPDGEIGFFDEGRLRAYAGIALSSHDGRHFLSALARAERRTKARRDLERDA